MDTTSAINSGISWLNTIASALAIVSAYGSVKVFWKLKTLQKQMRLKAAIPDVKKRLTAAQRNLNATLESKRPLTDDAAKLNGLLSDLSTKLARESDPDLEDLKREVAALLPVLRASPPSTDDYRKIPARLGTIIELLASAERDHKWSIT